MKNAFRIVAVVLVALLCGAWIRGNPSPTGRAQVNLGIPYATSDFPFLDAVKMLDRPWVSDGATEDPNLLIGATGYPSRMADVGQWASYTGVYFTGSDPWVLTWTGNSNIIASFYAPSGLSVSSSSSSNRVEYTISAGSSGATTGTPISVQLVITGITTSISNVRLFRKSQETLLNSGEIWNPDFLSAYASYGRVRFMDWQATNAQQTTRWVDRTTTSNISWTGANLNPSNYAGVATLSGNAYTAPQAVAGNPSSWVNGQQIQAVLPNGGTISFKSVTAFTAATTAQVTATAHGFNTGDVVFFSQGGWNGMSSLDGSKNIQNQTWGNFYTITKLDADNFTLDGTNSTTWGSYFGGAFVAKRITLAAGLLPAKRIVSSNLGGLGSLSIPNVISSAGGYAYAFAKLVYNSDVDALVLSDGSISGGAAADGVPWETMIALANRLGSHPWFCFPALADDDYVTQAATLTRNTLNSNLIASYELSNEIWNLGLVFSATMEAFKLGNVKWSLLGDSAINQWYGWRFYGMAGLVNTVYSGQLSRREMQFAVHTAQWNVGAAGNSDRFTAPATGTAAAPITRAASIALAPYMESDRATSSSAQYVWQQTQGGALAAAAMTWLDNYLRDDGINTAYTVKNLRDNVFPAWKTIANTPCSGCPAVKLTMYEGGFGYVPGLNPLTANNWLGNPLTNTDRNNFYFAYYRTALFAQTLVDTMNIFVAAGGEYPSQYTLVGKIWDADNMWGIIQPGLYGAQTPTYTAFRGWNFLLKRDVDPASNDNSPMWLEKAA